MFFQLQKFTQTASHVYLLGSIPALGKWVSQHACRMTQHSASDGTWRGEWRLELEIDDDFDVIEYTYMIVNEGDTNDQRRAALPDAVRILRLNSPEFLERAAEGGRIHVKDMFGTNKLGLPSASTPSSVALASASLKDPVKTPQGSARLISGSLPMDRELRSVRDFPLTSSVQRNLNEDLDDNTGSETSVSGAAHTQVSHNVVVRDSSPPQEDSSTGEVEIDKTFIDDTINLEIHKSEPDRDKTLLDWKNQLSNTDDHLLRSAERLRRRHSEVQYLKKRNSRDMTRTQVLIPNTPGSPEESSPVSSDGVGEDDNMGTDDIAEEVVTAPDHEEVKQLEKERDALALARDALAEENEALKRKAAESVATREKLTTAQAEQEDQLAQLRCDIELKERELEEQHAELVKRMGEEEAQIESYNAVVEEKEAWHARWTQEFKQRRELFNKVQELRGNIRVFCRVRPSKRKGFNLAVDFPDASLGEHSNIHISGKTFEFDHVFQPDSSQKGVYAETAGVVGSVLDGYNVCVFAYGQTGSGKTHTMNGTMKDPGVNVRALQDLFSQASDRGAHSIVDISVSMLEIYNECLRDLIRPERSSPASKLDIRKDPNSPSSNAVYVPNLTEIPVNSFEDIWEIMQQGSNNRSNGKTNMNEHSSRSHLIIRVTVKCEDLSSGVKCSGVLHLVDLAGSERVARSNASGDRLKEAQHINKSLATLGDVFTALTSNSSHIPFRNSRLTYLLQDCLGGNSKTLMFVNVSCDESDASETVSSLQFAQRVSKVELGNASRQMEQTSEKRARAALQEKETEVSEMQSKYSALQRDVRRRDDAVNELRQKLRSLENELNVAKNNLEEQNKLESGLASMEIELREVKLQRERDNAEARAETKRLREELAAKDEEINRLKTQAVGTSQAKEDEPSSDDVVTMEDKADCATQSLGRLVSAPTVAGGRRPERASHLRMQRSSSSISRSRMVRFDESEAQADLETRKTKDDTAIRTRTALGGAARRVKDSVTTSMRPQGATGLVRPQRPGSRSLSAPGGNAPAARKSTYAFGSRLENVTNNTDASTTVPKTSRVGRVPRAQTSVLRPPQRNHGAASAASRSSGVTASGLRPTGLRRAGTVASVSRIGAPGGATTK